MKMTLAILALTAVLRAADPEPVDPAKWKAREVPVPEGARLSDKFEVVLAAVKVTSEKELEKHVSQKEARAALLKAVNFSKEYLVIFTWAGSGGDMLTPEAVKDKDGTVAVFVRTIGLTKDLREHQKVYALPRKMGYRLGK
jgi:hypothetical protein